MAQPRKDFDPAPKIQFHVAGGHDQYTVETGTDDPTTDDPTHVRVALEGRDTFTVQITLERDDAERFANALLAVVAWQRKQTSGGDDGGEGNEAEAQRP